MPAPDPLTRACASSSPCGVTRQSSCHSTFSIEWVQASVKAAIDSVLMTPAEARQRLKPRPPRPADAAATARRPLPPLPEHDRGRQREAGRVAQAKIAEQAQRGGEGDDALEQAQSR